MEKFELILQQSPWFIPLCLLLGAIYAGILYYRDRHNEFSRTVRVLLMSLRFFVASFIAFLLLSPLVKTLSYESEKPTVVIAQDYSASLKMTRDSSYYQTAYLSNLRKTLDGLQSDYTLDTLSFGEATIQGFDSSFHHQYTDMGQVMDYVSTTYENRNLGAVIIASDGIINKGANPLYKARSLNAPVHVIAMGDTTNYPDLSIAAVRHNDIAYKDNKFPVEVSMRAEHVRGQEVVLRVYRNGKFLEEHSFEVSGKKWHQSKALTFDAEQKGIQSYSFRLSTLDEEKNKQNNSRKIFVEVLENRQRILLMGKRPHPDLSAIKRAVENNPNYTLDVVSSRQPEEALESYNLVILHGYPGRDNAGRGLLQRLESADIPLWFIPGPESNINYLNRFGRSVTVQAGKKAEEATGVLNTDFTVFSLPDKETDLVAGFPPLQSVYGKYRAADDSRILVYRKIGSVATSAPLWVLSDQGKRKYAITFGHGLWRWRIYNFLEKKNHQFIDHLISQTIKYLAVNADKSRFRFEHEPRYAEYEKVRIFAELYNKSYELVNDPEVQVNISDDQGKEYPYVMSRQEDAYALNLKDMKPGHYRYTAKTQLGGEQFEKSGYFVVEEVNLEEMNTKANHHLLYQVAGAGGGEVIKPTQVDRISQILEKQQLKPTTYTIKDYVAWIHLPWLLVLLIVLLSTEWLIRKLNGAL
ncbi:MAG: hypothetical protein R6T91_03815 [Bacteroidales bacterium]